MQLGRCGPLSPLPALAGVTAVAPEAFGSLVYAVCTMEQKIGSILPEAAQHHEAGCSNALNRAKLFEEEEEDK